MCTRHRCAHLELPNLSDDEKADLLLLAKLAAPWGYNTQEGHAGFESRLNMDGDSNDLYFITDWTDFFFRNLYNLLDRDVLLTYDFMKKLSFSPSELADLISEEALNKSRALLESFFDRNPKLVDAIDEEFAYDESHSDAFRLLHGVGSLLIRWGDGDDVQALFTYLNRIREGKSKRRRMK